MTARIEGEIGGAAKHACTGCLSGWTPGALLAAVVTQSATTAKVDVDPRAGRLVTADDC
jgi:hypothetical protein